MKGATAITIFVAAAVSTAAGGELVVSPGGMSPQEALLAIRSARTKLAIAKARRWSEDAVSMLGQIARRINSYLLPRIVALRLDLDRQWRSWNGNAPDKTGTRRLVDAFARCHDALFAEVGFLDVRERVKSEGQPPRNRCKTAI